MKPASKLISILLFACSTWLTADERPSSELLLERAFYLETIKGSPAEALELYRRIQQQRGLQKQVMARAILGEAICLDAIGKDRLARRRFQDVIQRYPRESKILKIARGYMRSRIWDTPARYMPEKMLFYAEMVQPGDEVIRLSRAVRGTPFENPIDSSRAQATDPKATAALQEQASSDEGGMFQFQFQFS